jgi:hypothetical protein
MMLNPVMMAQLISLQRREAEASASARRAR